MTTKTIDTSKMYIVKDKHGICHLAILTHGIWNELSTGAFVAYNQTLKDNQVHKPVQRKLDIETFNFMNDVSHDVYADVPDSVYVLDSMDSRAEVIIVDNLLINRVSLWRYQIRDNSVAQKTLLLDDAEYREVVEFVVENHKARTK